MGASTSVELAMDSTTESADIRASGIPVYHQICALGIFRGGLSTTIFDVKKNIIGSRVREARKESRITQVDLAARLQVAGIKIDQAGLSKLESGRRPVTDIEVAAIAGVLKVPVSQLFEENSDSPGP